MEHHWHPHEDPLLVADVIEAVERDLDAAEAAGSARLDIARREPHLYRLIGTWSAGACNATPGERYSAPRDRAVHRCVERVGLVAAEAALRLALGRRSVLIPSKPSRG